MRKAFFMAALMLGTAAVAQETMQEETTTDTTSETMQEEMPAQTPPPTEPTQTTPPMDPAPAPAPAPQPAPAPMAQPMGGGGTVAPGNQNPETDARGIKVVSDAAMAPSGANQAPPSGGPVVPAPNQAAVFQTQPSSKDYPTCSRTVTDGCVQSYERGRSPD